MGGWNGTFLLLLLLMLQPGEHHLALVSASLNLTDLATELAGLMEDPRSRGPSGGRASAQDCMDMPRESKCACTVRAAVLQQ